MMSKIAYVMAAMTLATVMAADEDASLFKGVSPFKSFHVQSPDNNPWSD